MKINIGFAYRNSLIILRSKNKSYIGKSVDILKRDRSCIVDFIFKLLIIVSFVAVYYDNSTPNESAVNNT